MKLVQINDFKIQDLSDATMTTFIKNQQIEGLDFSSIRLSNFNKAGDDGNYITNSFYGERRITIEGVMYSKVSIAAHEQLRRDLIEALTTEKDSDGFLVEKVLRITTNDDLDYIVYVEVASQPKISRVHKYVTEFLIDLIAHKNIVESYIEYTETINTYTGGGFVLPVILPIAFEAGSGGSIVINNGGGLGVKPVITLTGPLTNPRITNLTTGKYISLNLTMNLGDSIVIDMDNRTIVQGGVTSRMAYFVEGSEFWELVVGNNTVQLTTSVSDELGSASVVYREAWMGI